MKKLKLQKLIRHKLTSEISPKEMAIKYIIIGLKRDSQIINKDLICSRLGISNSISDSMINECIREIKTIINKLEERMNNERET
jgi:hypothetical protein